MTTKSVYNKIIIMTRQIVNFATSDTQILGRWCHVSLPKCSIDVIEKKIDFANRDNSLYFYKKSDNNRKNLYNLKS